MEKRGDLVVGGGVESTSMGGWRMRKRAWSFSGSREESSRPEGRIPAFQTRGQAAGEQPYSKGVKRE